MTSHSLLLARGLLLRSCLLFRRSLLLRSLLGIESGSSLLLVLRTELEESAGLNVHCNQCMARLSCSRPKTKSTRKRKQRCSSTYIISNVNPVNVAIFKYFISFLIIIQSDVIIYIVVCCSFEKVVKTHPSIQYHPAPYSKPPLLPHYSSHHKCILRFV